MYFDPPSPRAFRRSLGRQVTVSFHNFKSQKFKLSVSNPENKYVAYVSVLSQISNCQGRPQNKHEHLKTDRMPFPALFNSILLSHTYHFTMF